MSYYEYVDEDGSKGTGIDWDLAGCLHYNPQTFGVDEIAKVVAVVEGEHDGADWHWVLELKNGLFAYLTGGCDYTGWDCQSSAWSTVVPDASSACAAASDLTEDEYGYLSRADRAAVAIALQQQILESKAVTTKEQIGLSLQSG